MGLISIFWKKRKNLSHDMSCDASDTSGDISDTKTTTQKEEPLITISRQLTQVQYGLTELKPLIESSTQSLREDHYRILEEQVKSVEEYKKYASEKRENLKQAKELAEKELEHLDVDERILNLLENTEKRTVEISEDLKISRQYASNRIRHLLEINQIKKVKRGRKVYYTVKSE